MREMCRAKIHGATVTEANLHYVGSITIDKALMEAADILPYEKVQVVSLMNGERLETYVIEGRRGSGTICLNGAAARHAIPGDKVIIMSFGSATEEESRNWRPRVVFVDARNRRTTRRTGA